ncbi:MAG: TerB family tellurite resistance protein [Gammaproteobacteria bacterium]|nr:TerB family tellurite resistance protein [Gammaproteobacteria bacterium]
MLNSIKQFFEQNIAPDSQQDLEHSLRLATAALMVEMMNQDHKVQDEEEQAVRQLLQNKFGLDAKETGELFELASAEAVKATDYYQFTSLIKDHFNPDQKRRVVEQLWAVAYADGDLDPHEEHMVRRIAELLYVPHNDFIRAKHAVLDSMAE